MGKLVTISLGVFTTWLLILGDCIGGGGEERPIVKVVGARFDYRKDDNLKPPKDVGTILGKDNIIQLQRSMSHIFIECSASSPVQWHFEGVTAPLQLNMTSFRRLKNGTEWFVAEFFILRTTGQITGKWSCALLNQPEVRTEIHIFGEEQGYRGEDPFFLEYGKSLTVGGKWGEEVILPCVSWKRNIKAVLAKKVPAAIGTEYKDVDASLAKFDSTVGFRLQLTEPNPWGSYICYINLNKTFDVVRVTVKEKFNVIASPTSNNLELFEGTAMTLNCSTDDPRLQLSISYIPNGIVDPRIEYSANATDVWFVYHNLTFSDDGVAKCVAVDQNGKEVFEHLWSYTVINEADLKRRGWRYYFSRRTQTPNWTCWTKSYKVPSVAFVGCTSPMECQVKSNCFKRENRCDEIEARGCSGGCVIISIVKRPGILTCSGEGVDKAQVSLYIGTSNVTYNNTEQLKGDVLTAVSNTQNETYVGTIVEVNCTGSSFYFARGFHWSIRTWNDSEDLNRLDNDTRVLENLAEVLDFDEEFWSTGLIIVRSRIKLLSTEIKEIVCFAPHWNSFNRSSYPLPYTVKETTVPEFPGGNIEENYLDLGDINDTISCDAHGIPRPTVTWLKDGLHIPRTILVVNNGESLLFEEVTHAVHGTYTCTATNSGGSATKHFSVHVADPNYKVIVGVSVSGAIGMIVLLVILALFWRRIQRQKKMLRNLTDAEIEEFLYGNPDAINMSEDTNRQGHLLAYNREYEFPKDFLDIKMEEKLGSGAYGLVLKGIARGLFPGEEETIVAVKTLQPNADISYFKSILIELKIMSVIGRHAHIVNLLGACTTDIRKREIFIIVEFCANGSLEKFLKSHRTDFAGGGARYSVEPKRAPALYANQPDTDDLPLKITTLNLIQWCYEIATGMDYLSGKKVIHGDMAARNILVTDKLFAKIGDFGLSRQLYEYTNYVKKQQAPLPWRWMAIESLCDMEFSCKSDVWAYGITLWEIFSLGEVPYPGTSWTEDFVKKLRQGNRPPSPDQADATIYNVMVECWRYEPSDRPSFSELATIFMNMLNMHGVTVQEPPAPPMRKKFELQVSNGTYGINKEIIL